MKPIILIIAVVIALSSCGGVLTPDPSLMGDEFLVPCLEADTPPVFPGGMDSLVHYLSDRADTVTVVGAVSVQFTIGSDGYVSDILTVSPGDPYLSERARDIVESMPRWTPGMDDGHAVPIVYQVSIKFGETKNK